MNKTNQKKRADQYNDPSHNYLEYWQGREYENSAEQIAINRLLNNKHFEKAADIGGGYGRLCIFLRKFADHVTLAEPSRQQLDIAKEYLKDYDDIDQKLMQADDLKFEDSSLDLITMIRVMHHLPDPTTEFSEIARVLKPEGYFILEVANNAHFLNRLRYLFKGKSVPKDPVDIRSEANKRDDEIPFVNHHPQTVIRQLARSGLKVEKTLSVSNLRSTMLKRLLPKFVLLGMESILQKPLSPIYFGPSTFFLVRKITK